MPFQEYFWLACFENYELIVFQGHRYPRGSSAALPGRENGSNASAEVDKRSKIAATYTGIDRASTARLISSLSGLGLGALWSLLAALSCHVSSELN